MSHNAPTRARARTRASFVGVGVGAAVFAVLQIVQQTASAFDARPVITALLAALVALVSALLAHWGSMRRDARAQAELHRLLAVHPDEEPARADAIALGVFPGKRRRGRSPPYVTREIDADVRAAIASCTSVVVSGPPLAGKTRTVLEAVRDAAPGATIIAPRGPDELKALLSADPPLHVSRGRRILWLDDLPQYVEILDQPALDRLTQYFPVPRECREDELQIVATVRDDQWRAMLSSTGSAGQLARGLADRASVHQLPVTDEVFAEHAPSIYPDEAFPDGPGPVLATSGLEIEPPEPAAPLFESSGPQWWDRTATLLAGLVGLVVAMIVAVLMVSGFSKAIPPPIPAQIAGIERSAAAHNQYARLLVRGTVDLHGTGEESRVFILEPTSVKPGHPALSDELRVYDERDGWLREKFRFRPSIPDVKFQIRAAQDIDADGATEIVGGFALPDARNAMLPVALDWQNSDQRYAITPLDLGRPSLGRVKQPSAFAIQAGLYRKLYERRYTLDDASSSDRVTGRRVQDFVVTTPPRIVAAYFVRPPIDSAKDRAVYEIHAAIVAAGPSLSLTPCALADVPTPQMDIRLSERSQESALADTWASASANRYCALGSG
jgi:hypothetical protein